jgi:hypothetical protein
VLFRCFGVGKYSYCIVDFIFIVDRVKYIHYYISHLRILANNQALQDALKEMRGYWELKEETIDRTRWLIRFGRGCGSILRQTAE